MSTRTRTATVRRRFAAPALIAARERIGLSRSDLADAARVNLAQLGFWERGDYSPSLENAALLASTLGVSVDALLVAEVAK